MRVAIPTDGEYVSPHFRRCPFFTLIDIEGGNVVNTEVVTNPGHEVGLIPNLLHQKGVECVVCSGMGRRAISFFEKFGIQIIFGVTGRIDDIVEKLKNGSLEGGKSMCEHGSGRGYGLENKCGHNHEGDCNH